MPSLKRILVLLSSLPPIICLPNAPDSSAAANAAASKAVASLEGGGGGGGGGGGQDLVTNQYTWNGSTITGDCTTLVRAPNLNVTTWANPNCQGDNGNLTVQPFYSIGLEQHFQSYMVNRDLQDREQMDFSTMGLYHDRQGHAYEWECGNYVSSVPGNITAGHCYMPPVTGQGGWLDCWRIITYDMNCTEERIQLYSVGTGPVTSNADVGWGSMPGKTNPYTMPGSPVTKRFVEALFRWTKRSWNGEYGEMWGSLGWL